MCAKFIDRRGLIRLAAVAGLPISTGLSGSALAQPRTETNSMSRDIERFAKRLDLIRQSLDIPGMSVAVLHKQTIVLARGFGVADIAKGTAATENTPYPIASLTNTTES
jgi:CubicO group peptidase (beta-lactamase class C family)